ncbi:hypothetical protein FHS29_006403 [Saccharothrix tamanrassetensis]|uniref:SH3 domain-containing protein n=1 Tax=Saccharothrix tamanrassetensis TaxID=1051531 RepID=A0A841CMT6_9PSEU|nr:hypothetical protein [Saccharothrix tamanrassetensis]MBB5959782.1 hypothetical protein [Saccharothrix tamanrassetensis]
MRTLLRGAASAALASALVMSVATGAEATVPNDLCRTNIATTLYTSPTSGIHVPKGALVRILDYRGPVHYLARYDGTVGQIERKTIIQSSCYQQ